MILVEPRFDSWCFVGADFECEMGDAVTVDESLHDVGSEHVELRDEVGCLPEADDRC